MGKKINLNSNGSFDFIFQTSGNGIFYKLFIEIIQILQLTDQFLFEQKLTNHLQ
jgi:hypothetical protein